MARCPNCGAEISSLEYVEEKSHSGSVELVDGKLVYDIRWTNTEMAYDCPECDAGIATDEATAKSFLEGEHNGQT